MWTFAPSLWNLFGRANGCCLSSRWTILFRRCVCNNLGSVELSPGHLVLVPVKVQGPQLLLVQRLDQQLFPLLLHSPGDGLEERKGASIHHQPHQEQQSGVDPGESLFSIYWPPGHVSAKNQQNLHHPTGAVKFLVNKFHHEMVTAVVITGCTLTMDFFQHFLYICSLVMMIRMVNIEF